MKQELQEYGNVVVIAEWTVNEVGGCLLGEVSKTTKGCGISVSWEMRDGWQSPLLAEAAGKRNILIFLNGEEPGGGEALLNEVPVRRGDTITIASLG